jgi:uncharacterized RDD family membrane protein YckC
MSSTEPPVGSTPPPGEPTPPPPPPANPVTMPPPDQSMAPPPPPPPPAGAAAPMPGAPMAAAGVPRPGELLDRFLARLIDGVILGIVMGILFGILGAILISNAHYDSDGTFHSSSSLLFYIVYGVVTTLLNVGYYTYMESSRGQTIGKIVMKLRTFGPDGASNPTTEQALRRNIFTAWPVAYIIPVAGIFLGPLAGLAAFVGEIMIAVGINNDPVRRQAWHDKFAGGTQVMKIG